MKKQKIGIYSGVFDPVHHGHISFAQKAINQLGLDKVYFLVEPEPRYKKSATNIRHRLNMMWLALRDHKHMQLLELDHDTFSVKQSLPWLQQRLEDAELFLLMGSDAFKQLHNWPGFAQLQQAVHFVVGQRDEDDTTKVPIEHTPITTAFGALSSSSARRLSPAELSTTVPELVAQYAQTNHLYDEADDSVLAVSSV